MGVGLVAVVTMLITTSRYEYPTTITSLPQVIASHVADPSYRGSSLIFEGRVRSVYTLETGMTVMSLYDPEGDVNMGVTMFPSLGCLPVMPVKDETVRITGNLGMYQGKPQIQPLSADHVQVLTDGEDAQQVPLSSVSDVHVGQTLVVGPVVADRVTSFESQHGRRHLQIEFADAAQEGATERKVGGIMFQSRQTPCAVRRLRSKSPIAVKVDVSDFNGALSLSVQQVVPPQ